MWKSRALLSAAVILCLAIAALAQQPSGAIAGVVTDRSGAVIAGATVVVTSSDTGATLTTRTTGSGNYSVASLLPGKYELRISAEGFRTTRVRVDVLVGVVTTANLRLEVGSTGETVCVDANAVAVNTVQPTLQGVITTDVVHALPLNGRQVLDLGQLEPGVQIQDGGNFDPTKGQFTGLSIASQSGRTSRVTVDGLDITDELVGTSTANLSQDALQEFQIARSALDVSTGLTGTGAVNVITKTGSGQLHGAAFAYFRHNRFAARVSPTEVPFQRNQDGFSLGGPFLRNRLFWFVNFERNNQKGAVVTSLAGFPQFNGTWRVPFDERMGTARLDANLTRGVRAFYRLIHDDNNGIGTGAIGFGGKSLSPYANRNNTNQHALGLDIAGGRFTHSFRYGFLNFQNYIVDARDQINGLPRTLDPAGRDLLVGFAPSSSGERVGPNFEAPQSTLQHNNELRYDGGASFGRHVLRWGGLVNVIRKNVFASFWGNAPEIDVNVNAATQVQCGADPLCYPVTQVVIGNSLGAFTDVPTLDKPWGGARNTRVHWYLADTWHATSRLTLNYGLRWVYEPGQNHPEFDKPALLDAFSPGLAAHDRRIKNNFAPYFGFAWDPTGSGKWVIRGAGGRFFDTNTLNLFERARNIPPGISNVTVTLPNTQLINPLDGSVMFDPGPWIGQRLDTPGLIDAILAAANAFQRASAAATANFPSGQTLFEKTRATEVLNPNFKSPYAMQFNIGVQRELRPGLVFSVDYVRSRGIHYPLRQDWNRVGAANSLNITNALTAIANTNAVKGCNGTSSAAIDCAIGKGATIEDYAKQGLGSRQAASCISNIPGAPCIPISNRFAFGGIDPRFNSINVVSMMGVSDYQALQASLRGRLPNIRNLIRNWNVVTSYSFGRLKATSSDQNQRSSLVDNDQPHWFYGPAALDRTHMLSVGSTFRVPGGVDLNSIWRFNSSLPQSVLVPAAVGGPAEIFFTDFNGDGTTGDPLPGTNMGSFGRSLDAAGLNRLISSFNSNLVGTFTPAAQALIAAGLFTPAQLQQLHAVLNRGKAVPLAPAGQVSLDSFMTTDLRLSRPVVVANERIRIEPGLEFFNLFNVANFDLAGNVLGARLTGTQGSINGTTVATRTTRAGYGSGSFAQGIPRAWQLFLRVTF